ncbi:protein translocase subunit SecDF [Cesiribacter sp. SM1]|uniref:protein translocase subunit SecDF n=1 Tax=Cesiribacter sp. SM1 TaxID=2861196 RepID=UPI001CD3BE48|nr:protein translocase subunit SecDF [Cesiribacter sp. SM1]
MRNKSFIVVLTVLVSALCIFYLSFTFVSRNIQKSAERYALQQDGNLDYRKQQHYLDSLWRKPVYNFLGMEFTYQEVKEYELNLGLDLQGGMYMVLEVAPADILTGMSGNSTDPQFLAALEAAKANQGGSSKSFVQLFYEAFQEIAPDRKLAELFLSPANKDKISLESTNTAVVQILEAEVNDAMDRSFKILRTRVDKFGVANPNLQRLPGTDRIQVELPGVDNPERVRKLMQGVAKLEFWKVYEVSELYPELQAANEYWVNNLNTGAEAKAAATPADELASLLSAGDTISAAGTATDSVAAIANPTEVAAAADSLAPSPADQLSPLFSKLKSQYSLVYALEDTAAINQFLATKEIQELLPHALAFKWEVKATAAEDGAQYLELYALKKESNGKAALNGEVVTDARQDFSENGQPAVSMQMDGFGARQWQKLTSESIGRRVAIVLDGFVYSAPVVQSEIPNGYSSISGSFTIDEAKDLANILKAGKLPAPTTIVEEAVVGPSLGLETIQQGLLSMAAGLGLVVIFMIFYYGSGGIVANAALFVNVFFILGILAQFSAALTLPGIAGIVLTIGMSVDANVLIFERIKEELLKGKGLVQAIKLGYDKAYSSILDSNITTFLTGAILYMFGSGPVKGFAVVLMIGIVSSLFTAVFITRLLIEWMARKDSKLLLSFSTPFSRSLFRNLNIDFIGKRKMAYAFSALVIGAGLVSILLQGGLNLGVDFRGGRSYVVKFSEPLPAAQVREALADDFEQTGLEVKTFNGKHQLKITTSYLIQDETGTADEKVEAALKKGLEEFSDKNPALLSSSKVGATMADDIQGTARTSILYSLGIIFLYILIRFQKWQYGAGALIALTHDVLIVFSGFALARWFGIQLEIDQVFIAAVLTVVGYSINDTVVVFDRIREFFKDEKDENLPRVLNASINSTLSRTIITSLTVFIVVLVLFMFGGDALRGFSFALLLGVIFGTYSSIFIAAPIVLDFIKNKKPGEAEVAQKTTKTKKAIAA